jgi:acetyl esterase/lipase
MTDKLARVTSRQSDDGGVVFEGLTYAEVSGFRPLLLDLHVPPGPGPAPVAVWVHGGGFRWGDRRYPTRELAPEEFWRAATRAGLAVATIDYRLSGEALFPAQLEDARAALAFLRRHADQLGLDAGRIALWGESSGAAIAALAAFADRAVRAVAAWYPVTDMGVRNPMKADSSEGLLVGGIPAELPELIALASPLHQVPADPPPFLLVHGTADTVAVPAHSERLHKALLAAGGRAELDLLPGAVHAFTGHPDVRGLVDRTVAFLAEELA